MKKWWVFPLIAVVAVGGIRLLSRNRQEIATVRTAVLQPQAVEQTVSCSGVIEAGGSYPVLVPATCVLGEVDAQKGQLVQAGDVLARVDKAASRAAVAQSVGEAAQVLALAAAPETITAPVSGVLVAVNASAGEYLSVGEPLAVLAPIDSLRVRVAIREKDLPRLRVGQAVHVRGDGFEKTVYEGELTRISAAGSQTSTGDTVVEGVVTLKEGQADDSLRLGLTARAQVVTATAADGLLLPYAAIQEDDDGQEYIFLLQDNRAVRYTIGTKTELSRGVLIDDTALSGATVILEPQKVKDGAAVTPRTEDTL